MTTTEGDIEKSTDFKWLKENYRGGRNKDVRFFDSFSLKGVECALYDSIQIFKDDEPAEEPFIGKLIKIWERIDKSKRVKEAIVGKLNVVCISQDPRNLQPSEEVIQFADFVFYRTFDVGKQVISEEFDEQIADIDIKLIFTRADDRQTLEVSRKKSDDSLISGSMTTTEEDIEKSTNFKWLKEKYRGGRNKDVRFFDSFSLKGVEYALYDSVQIFNDDEPAEEPFIGKLIKIWERIDKSKRVKVLCYIRPHQILKHLGPQEPARNELFLACGEGSGLTSVNPLEAIVGKFNVVCISQDPRNLQPSEEVIQFADFVFYRTFDVGKQVISEEFDEQIADIDIKLIFTRVDDRQTLEVSRKKSDDSLISGSMTTTEEDIEKSTDFKWLKEKYHGGRNKDVRFFDSFSLKGVEYALYDSVQIFKDDEPAEEPFIGKLIKIWERIDKSKRVKEAIVGKLNVVCISQDPRNLQPSEEVIQFADFVFYRTFDVGKQVISEEFDEKIADIDIKLIFTRVDDRQTLEVSRKKSNDTWEEKMKNACKSGRLVLLRNLHPCCTSKIAEDIVFHAFGQSAEAKMIRKNAYSSPLMGQAFLILSSQKIAHDIVTRLDEGCLVLPCGRYLLGYLVTDELEEEMKMQEKQMGEGEALTKSHYYPRRNTLPHKMAIEWRSKYDKSKKRMDELFEV
ncbi:hypothetical protein ACFE04_015954 [Oxalis oulophora]